MDAELKAFLEWIASSLDGLRSDMDRLRSELRAEIPEVEARLNARIDGVGRLALDANRTLRPATFGFCRSRNGRARSKSA